MKSNEYLPTTIQQLGNLIKVKNQITHHSILHHSNLANTLFYVLAVVSMYLHRSITDVKTIGVLSRIYRYH